MTRSERALDTSVTVPHLLRSHPQHGAVRRQLAGSTPCLTAHSLAETYSVLTRLPGDARLAPMDAVALIDSNYSRVLTLDSEVSARVHAMLGEQSVAGGAVYDGLVALAAFTSGVTLVTRDARAATTYRMLGVDFDVLG